MCRVVSVQIKDQAHFLEEMIAPRKKHIAEYFQVPLFYTLHKAPLGEGCLVVYCFTTHL